MNLQSINESFKKIVHGTSYTNSLREALGEGAEGEKLELADGLFNAIRSLRGKGVSDMKTYEKAFQDVLERIFPEKDWFEVTSVNIFWDLMSTKDPEQTAINILADIYRPEETAETEETVEVTEDTVKRGGKWMNVGKDGSHGTFRTKKAADAQRKAMFARGFKEAYGSEKHPEQDAIEAALKNIRGTERVEFDYRPNDGVYKKPEDHLIALVFTDNMFAPSEGEDDPDDENWFKNREKWKKLVLRRLDKMGWELEDHMEDNDTYLYLVLKKKEVQEGKTPVNEGYDETAFDVVEWLYQTHPEIDFIDERYIDNGVELRFDFNGNDVEKIMSEVKEKFGENVSHFNRSGRDYIVVKEEENIEESKNPLTEAVDTDDRRKALADHLGVDIETITTSSYDDKTFETEDGEEYLVLDSDEAREAAIEAVKNDLDDIGIEGFTDDFKDWAYRNAIETDWFDDALRESKESYADDIESEDDNEYGNRLIHEMYDEGILEDDDFEKDEDGEIDYTRVKETVDIDSKKEDFVDKLVENMGDAVEWYRSDFGEDELSRTVREYDLIDADAVAEEAIDWDGVEHFLAFYDGKEIELDDGWYAYRTN